MVSVNKSMCTQIHVQLTNSYVSRRCMMRKRYTAQRNAARTMPMSQNNKGRISFRSTEKSAQKTPAQNDQTKSCLCNQRVVRPSSVLPFDLSHKYVLRQHRQSYNFLFQLCTLDRCLLLFVISFHTRQCTQTQRAERTQSCLYAKHPFNRKESAQRVAVNIYHLKMNHSVDLRICLTVYLCACVLKIRIICTSPNRQWTTDFTMYAKRVAKFNNWIYLTPNLRLPLNSIVERSPAFGCQNSSALTWMRDDLLRCLLSLSSAFLGIIIASYMASLPVDTHAFIDEWPLSKIIKQIGWR